LRNVKQKAFLFLITAFFIFIPHVCLAEKVKVNLIWKFPAPSWLEIEILEGKYSLRYNQTTQELNPNQEIKVGCTGWAYFLTKDNEIYVLTNSKVSLCSGGEKGVFRLREPGKGWISYRGDLELGTKNLEWRVFNTLEQEDYLKGVVPNEMSNSWAAQGFEALKAQAVTARTYLLKNMDHNGVITDSPNIHQAYGGKSVEGEASRAVEETKGELLVDLETGKPIDVFYSAHNGGHSEVTENVWISKDPHYEAKPDPFSQGVGGFADRWRFFIAADVLGQSFDLAPIRQVRPKKYESGRVFEVYLLDWLGNEKIISGDDFVKKFYPRNRALGSDCFLSRLFEVYNILGQIKPHQIPGTFKSEELKPPSPGPVLSRLKSSGEDLSPKERNFGVYVFEGRGWGHGVGMSQWGAYQMAKEGYTYRQILEFYYKNSVLRQSNT
jgi:stage II sporulation protein D